MTGILILNYNNTTDIKSCVESVKKYVNSSQYKLLVIDNGSRQTVYEDVKSYLYESCYDCQILYNGVITELAKNNYLRLPQNIGYARGNNAGLEYFYADSDITEILILNSDIILTSDIVTPLVARLYEISDVGSVSPILYKPDGKIDHCCARKNFSKSDLTLTFSILWAEQYRKRKESKKILLNEPELLQNHLIEIELPSGSCMLFRKDILKQIGGFDKNTFLYYEESILFKKMQNLGCTSYLIPSVSCIHTGGATTVSTQTAYFLKKCNFESMVYYCKKYENMQLWQMIYIYITASIVLIRLWLGRMYHKCVKIK